MLRAIPVEAFHLDDEAPLHLRRVVVVFQTGQQFGLVQPNGAHPAQHFQAGAIRVVHKKQRHAVLAAEVTAADVLAVAGVVGETDRALVHHLHESRGTTAVLHVRPAGLAHTRHVKAVPGGDEGRLAGAQPVVVVLAPVHTGITGAAAFLLLDSPNNGGEGDLGEFVGHAAVLLGRPGRRLGCDVATLPNSLREEE